MLYNGKLEANSMTIMNNRTCVHAIQYYDKNTCMKKSCKNANNRQLSVYFTCIVLAYMVDSHEMILKIANLLVIPFT